MDYELIWWIAALAISVVSIVAIANYNRPKHNDDPYRYCPKED